jgi:polysaccharide export outer membrane protein
MKDRAMRTPITSIFGFGTRALACVALVAIAPLAALAQGTAPAATSAPSATPASAPPATDAGATQAPSSYLFGPHDVINIAVVGRSDFNQQVLVQDDGTISLALIGSITAANLTPLQLKSVIEQRLRSGGYFLKPEVTVTLSGAASQYAVVLGDIGSPGLAALDRPYHLSELVARSGGVKQGSDILTVTTAAGETREFSLRAIATGASPDPMVAPGTKIYVQPAQLFYIYGQVGSPGTYALERDMTVRNALARAGGLSALGSTKKIKIYRGDKEFKPTDLNQKLMPGDTINVGERFF